MLKRILFFLFISTSLIAQTEKTVKSSIQKVTVFLRGAQLFSDETVFVPSGTSQIIFENVSPDLQESSLQVTSKSNNYVITDTRFNLQYTEQGSPQNLDERKKKIQNDLKLTLDSLTDADLIQQLNQKNIENLQTEKKLLLESKIARGDTRDSLPLLIHSLDFVRERLKNIEVEIIKLTKQKSKDDELRLAVRQRRDVFLKMLDNKDFNNQNKPTPQIIVTVFANASGTGEFKMNYYVANAGWSTNYDLLASGDKSVIDFKQNALVNQNSGIDWKNVSLTLSTGNPNLSNEKPNLPTQFARYNQDQILYEVLPNNRSNSFEKTKSESKADDMISKLPSSNFSSDFPDNVTVTENLLRIEYEIPTKYDIPAGNKTHNVVIQTQTLNAEYTFAVVPKMDADVFLIARIADWEKLNLIAGKARLYFDGSYVGESSINPKNTTDTLLLNLGRDKSIVVTRNKIKEKSKEKILSDNRFLTQMFEITVRNTKSVPIRLIAEDQMPVTREAGIKIEYTDLGGAKFSENSGKLIWDLNLKPRETKKLSFSYDIKYPKEKILIGF